MRPQQAAGVKVGEQMLHGQQGMDFLGGEPQAGQFVLRSDRERLAVDITARFTVPNDGCVEAIAQVFQIALQRRPRDFQSLLQSFEGGDLGRSQHHVDQVKAFGPIHVFLSKVRCAHCRPGFIGWRFW